jgi:hypothetical protein
LRRIDPKQALKPKTGSLDNFILHGREEIIEVGRIARYPDQEEGVGLGIIPSGD